MTDEQAAQKDSERRARHAAARRGKYAANENGVADRNKAQCKAYYLANKEAIAARNRAWREANKEILKEKRKQWKPKRIEWLRKNKNAVEEVRKAWRDKNRSRLTKNKRHRLRTDPAHAMVHRIQTRMNHAIRRGRTAKTGRTMELVGCTPAELCKHLESLFLPGMTWENRREWHIDHISPVSSFDLTKESEQRKCFHYTNLQPLWAIDNIKKSNRLLDETTGGDI